VELWTLVLNMSSGKSSNFLQVNEVVSTARWRGSISQYSVIFPSIQFMSREFLVFGWMFSWLAS
jgi:hypothetical protein